MEESIRNEIIQSLEVGKNYHFESTYNGGGYDWSNLNVFSEPMRFEMEMWLENTSICGFAVDVTLRRKSKEELDFTLHAHQTSPPWYSNESILSFFDLAQNISLKRYFKKDTSEIRILFCYLYKGGEYTFELNESAEAMLISEEDDDEIFIPIDKLPAEFINELERFIDSFRQGLSTPKDFTLSQIEIRSDDIDSEDITVYESWQQTYSLSLKSV